MKVHSQMSHMHIEASEEVLAQAMMPMNKIKLIAIFSLAMI